MATTTRIKKTATAEIISVEHLVWALTTTNRHLVKEVQAGNLNDVVSMYVNLQEKRAGWVEELREDGTTRWVVGAEAASILFDLQCDLERFSEDIKSVFVGIKEGAVEYLVNSVEGVMFPGGPHAFVKQEAFYNEAGFDSEGYDEEGYDEDGLNDWGIDRESNDSADPDRAYHDSLFNQ